MCAAPTLLAAYRDADPQAGLARWRERFLTHAVYRVPALRSALAQQRAGGHAWLARFDWQPSGPWVEHGAAHGFDEPFVWGRVDPRVHRYTEGSADAPALAARMATALRQFAHAGDPGWAAFDEHHPAPHRLAPPGTSDSDETVILAAWQRCGLLEPAAALRMPDESPR